MKYIIRFIFLNQIFGSLFLQLAEGLSRRYPHGCLLLTNKSAEAASLVEMFGQVTAEHLSRETLVVCIDTSGLRDIVLQAKTEMVASAFDVKSLMDCLLSMINLSKYERLQLGQCERRHILGKFSYFVVSKHYLKIFENAVMFKKVHTT
jgi:glycosyltransferase involved in cell wall biosynthesis